MCRNRGWNEICPAAEIQIVRFVTNAQHKNWKSGFKNQCLFSLVQSTLPPTNHQLTSTTTTTTTRCFLNFFSPSINKTTIPKRLPPRVQAKRANLSSSHKGKPKYCNGCRTLGALTDQTAPRLNPLSFGAGGTWTSKVHIEARSWIRWFAKTFKPQPPVKTIPST